MIMIKHYTCRSRRMRISLHHLLAPNTSAQVALTVGHVNESSLRYAQTELYSIPHKKKSQIKYEVKKRCHRASNSGWLTES